MDKKTYQLKIVSDEVKSKIQDMEVISPTIFATIFSDVAREHDVDLDSVDQLIDNDLSEKFKQINILRKKTAFSMDKLDTTTKVALDAMNKNNSSLLNKALAETKSLRKEIIELKNSLYKDSLTGAYNRKWFDDKAQNENKSLVSGCLVMVDMNHFQKINEEYGHIAGDKLLKLVVEHLKKTNSYVIRYGGDEFVLIFQDKDINEVLSVMHKSREVLFRKQIKHKDSFLKTSFSYGATILEKNALMETVIRDAESLMFEDKEQMNLRLST